MVKRKQDEPQDDELMGYVEVEDDDVVAVDEPTPPSSDDDIVDQVLRGDWGVGQDRRLRLSQAGHDANAIQREIVRRANQK